MNKADEMLLQKISWELKIGISLLENADLEQFLNEELLKRASSMTIINIGELIKNLSLELRKEHSNVLWKAIAGFRDIAAHKYLTLRMNDVYETIKADFPLLYEQIQTILDKA